MQTDSMKYGDWLNLNSHLIWCYDQRILVREVPMHSHGNNVAWLVRKGWALLEHDGKTFRAEPGQWLIPKPTQRWQTFSADTILLSVAFEASWPDGTLWLDDGLSVVIDASECPELEETALPMVGIMKRLGMTEGRWEVRNELADAKTFLALEGYLSNWLAVLLDSLALHGVHPNSTYAMDHRIMSALRILQSWSPETAFDLKRLSANVGLSPVHLSRLFQQSVKQTPKGYYEELRVEYAKKHLSASMGQIKELAYTLGFNHLSNFSNWFKKHTGQSPKTFRQRTAAGIAFGSQVRDSRVSQASK